MNIVDNVKGLQHIGIPTNDMEVSQEFYKKLGFRLVYETINGTEKVAFFELKGLLIEIYQNNKATLKDGVVDHIAIDVINIDAAYEVVKENGIKVIEEITYLPFWENGVKYFLFEGPNKERLEFSQYL